jgi:NAD(P)-dependent dehydrogenase (short-subunit alcohol dehydrogenase family)
MRPSPKLLRAWILVSPSSRGIGHAITRHLLRTTNVPVVATARSNIDSVRDSLLKDLPDVDSSRLTLTQLDVLDESSILSATQQCEESFPLDQNHLHLAFAIPGILHPERSPEQIDSEKALQTLKINTLGPMLLMKHFARFLPSKTTDISQADDYTGLHPSRATWALMSARVGSITDNSLGGWYSYRSSKAGVTQLARTLDRYLAQQKSGDKAVSVALHPGTVKTGLSREFWDSVKDEKLFEPEWVAERLCGMLAREGESEVGRGRFWDYKGDEVPP